MNHCESHQELIDDVKEIKADVKTLLSFKSKIFAGLTVICFLVTVGINFLIK